MPLPSGPCPRPDHETCGERSCPPHSWWTKLQHSEMNLCNSPTKTQAKQNNEPREHSVQIFKKQHRWFQSTDCKFFVNTSCTWQCQTRLTDRGFSFVSQGDPEFPRSNTGPVSRSYVESARADNAAMQRAREDTQGAVEKGHARGRSTQQGKPQQWDADAAQHLDSALNFIERNHLRAVSHWHSKPQNN